VKFLRKFIINCKITKNSEIKLILPFIRLYSPIVKIVRRFIKLKILIIFLCKINNFIKFYFIMDCDSIVIDIGSY